MSLFKRLPANERGRDFIVGDIHGCFDLVEQALAAVAFDREADRLISVGDLVDRGPDSDQALDWLARPWFHAVMGNHELLTMNHALGLRQDGELHLMNGGAWFVPLDADVKREYAEAFARLPLAIEVPTPEGPVGVVHADVPAGMAWQELVAELERGDMADAFCLTWSRARIAAAMRGQALPNVPGILRVYVGHTPQKDPLGVGNVSFIDTGACFGGGLVLINAADGAIAARVGP